MKKVQTLAVLLGFTIVTGVIGYNLVTSPVFTGAPPEGIAEEEVPADLDPYAWLLNWSRPEGPAKVGIQVGHWLNQEVPEELKGLRDNHGAEASGVSELEINQAIATELKNILEAKGVQVDLLPATVPPNYWADVFIAVHADGSEDPFKSGYKFAPPWRDFTGKADDLVESLEVEYAAATNMEKDPNITRNMRGYYAFSFWRYEHAIHPMTTAVIAETGFVTNAFDRDFLVTSPEVPARAMAKAILKHLRFEKLL